MHFQALNQCFIRGRKCKILWGKSRSHQTSTSASENINLPAVPGLPAAGVPKAAAPPPHKQGLAPIYYPSQVCNNVYYDTPLVLTLHMILEFFFNACLFTIS